MVLVGGSFLWARHPCRSHGAESGLLLHLPNPNYLHGLRRRNCEYAETGGTTPEADRALPRGIWQCAADAASEPDAASAHPAEGSSRPIPCAVLEPFVPFLWSFIAKCCRTLQKIDFSLRFEEPGVILTIASPHDTLRGSQHPRNRATCACHGTTSVAL